MIIAGVDEVGRGPLAGPVLAAAVILDPTKKISGLADSKILTAKKREQLFPLIQNCCLAWSIGRASVTEIDAINIFQATLLAMQRAIDNLKITPEKILVDGTHCPKCKFTCEIEAIIDGDALIPVISAASIIAKVIRDKEMIELDAKYPAYGFLNHKGYGTKQHLLALKKFGPCPIHRRSFAPVKEL